MYWQHRDREHASCAVVTILIHVAHMHAVLFNQMHLLDSMARACLEGTPVQSNAFAGFNGKGMTLRQPYPCVQRIPQRIIEAAVKGMLPKGTLGRELFHHLKVYKGAAHPHEAQQPINITNTIDRKSGEMRGAVLADGSS